MKPHGAHPHHRLTDRAARHAVPGFHADGGGLYLAVDASGARRWTLRLMVRGKRRELGLGGYPLVSLADARLEALELRRAARKGLDPRAARQRLRGDVPTFAEAANVVHASKLQTWRNVKHGAQWLTTLERFAFPTLGALGLHEIETPDILKVLAPIWLSKPETARRVRQRIGSVLAWGKAAGHRSGENPVEGVALGLPKQTDRPKHHAAVPFADVPLFISDFRDSDASMAVKLALEFTVLTAARTSESLNARLCEINHAEKIWTIPAERMKAGRQHRVPLSKRCIEILQEAALLSDCEYLFPSRVAGKPLSNMALLKLVRRMRPGFTVHGFRSSFRDWSAERTHFPNEVCEQALAHTIKDKAEKAYRRGDMLDKRRELMDSWAVYLAPSSADIVQISTRGAA